MKLNYPEIKELKDFFKGHAINIKLLDEKPIGSHLTPVQFSIDGLVNTIHVIDEYNDLARKNKYLDLVVVLRELEMIEDSTDYLDWCKQQGLEVNNNLLMSYYQDMVKNIVDIRAYFPSGEINSFISDWAFEMNAGAAQYLRS